MRQHHQPSPARVQASAKHARDYWRSTILAQALSSAALLGWLQPHETELTKLPAELAQRIFGKSRELLEKCCEASAAGQTQHRIGARMSAELMNFMKVLAPSTTYPAKTQSGVGVTSELFPPHEDTTWPTTTR